MTADTSVGRVSQREVESRTSLLREGGSLNTLFNTYLPLVLAHEVTPTSEVLPLDPRLSRRSLRSFLNMDSLGEEKRKLRIGSENVSMIGSPAKWRRIAEVKSQVAISPTTLHVNFEPTDRSDHQKLSVQYYTGNYSEILIISHKNERGLRKVIVNLGKSGYSIDFVEQAAPGSGRKIQALIMDGPDVEKFIRVESQAKRPFLEI